MVPETFMVASFMTGIKTSRSTHTAWLAGYVCSELPGGQPNGLLTRRTAPWLVAVSLEEEFGEALLPVANLLHASHEGLWESEFNNQYILFVHGWRMKKMGAHCLCRNGFEAVVLGRL